MNVGQYCKRGVVTVAPTADVAEAARLMRDEHVGFLVVVEADVGTRRPIGVLTDRDIVLEVVAQDVDPHALTVGDVMTRQPMLVAENDDLQDVMQGMRLAGIRRVPVVDDRGGVTGIIAADDTIDMITGMLCDLAGSIRNEQRREWRSRLAVS